MIGVFLANMIIKWVGKTLNSVCICFRMGVTRRSKTVYFACIDCRKVVPAAAYRATCPTCGSDLERYRQRNRQ